MRHSTGEVLTRTMVRAGAAVASFLAASTALTGVAAAQIQTTSAARVELVSSADGSHPFNSALYARVPQNLAASHYVETEYFLTGLAKAYAYTAPSSTTNDAYAAVQTAAVPYVNRILVRAPAAGQPFSGNVIVEIANDALISDNETQWPFANSQFIANGDAYILLTSTPSGLQTLKAYDDVRYRALSWPTVAATKSCDGGAAEGGLIYDQVTQLGNLLRAGGASSPLPNFAVKHLFLTGYSGAASILLAYDRVFALNSTLWDAYFVASGGFRSPLNNCEASSVASSKTEPPASSTAAVFQTQTESELYLASAEKTSIPSSADSNSPRYRYYEIAGTSHVNGDLLSHSPERSDFPTVAGVTYLTDVTQSQLTSECGETSGSVISAFPTRYVYDALWANLEHWATATAGTYEPPSESSRITDTNAFTYLGVTAPTGGVRSPAVDDPIDSYPAGSIETSGSTALMTFCALTGSQLANGSAIDATKVVSDATTLNGEGFLTAADLAAIKANPTLAFEYPNGTTTIPDGP